MGVESKGLVEVDKRFHSLVLVMSGNGKLASDNHTEHRLGAKKLILSLLEKRRFHQI